MNFSIFPKKRPSSGVFLEKLTVALLVKNFPAYYGTRNVITVITKPA